MRLAFSEPFGPVGSLTSFPSTPAIRVFRSELQFFGKLLGARARFLAPLLPGKMPLRRAFLFVLGNRPGRVRAAHVRLKHLPLRSLLPVESAVGVEHGFSSSA